MRNSQRGKIIIIIIIIMEVYKLLTSEISDEKTWTWLRKGNIKKQTESLLATAQNNAIRTNHFNARIDKTQQNSKCRLCGDRNETINRIVSKCCRLVSRDIPRRR